MVFKYRRIQPSLIFSIVFLVFFSFIYSSSGDSKDAGSKHDWQTMPLIDVHSHLYRGEQDIDEYLSFMEKNNVRLAGFSGLTWSDADEIVLAAEKLEPEKFLAFLRGFDPERDHSGDYVYNRMIKEPFSGIGELFINGHGRSISGKNPELMKIYKTAGSLGVPVLVHWTIGSSNPKEMGTDEALINLKHVLKKNPKTIFILGHCGAGPPPCKADFFDTLESLFLDFSNLNLDLSRTHNRIFQANGDFTPFGFKLIQLVKKYPHRFLLGFDLGDPGTLSAEADRVVGIFRLFLGKLDPRTAKMVASGNALKIFKPCLERNKQIRNKKPYQPKKYHEWLLRKMSQYRE